VGDASLEATLLDALRQGIELLEHVAGNFACLPLGAGEPNRQLRIACELGFRLRSGLRGGAGCGISARSRHGRSAGFEISITREEVPFPSEVSSPIDSSASAA
jgi:hypothetical protein